LCERQAKSKATQILKEAEAYSKAKMMEADMIREKIISNSEARLECAKDKSEAFLKECTSERVQAENMQAKREH